MSSSPERCSLCGGNSFEVVATKLRYKKDQKGYHCNGCSLVFLHPPMSPEEERRFYEEEYGIIYSEEKNTTPKDLFTARQDDARMYLDWSRDWLTEQDDCLEVGCASGYFLAVLRGQVKSVLGLETHKELRSFCQEMGIPMGESLADCPDDSVDRFFAFFVLEHLGDPAIFLSEARRVCRPGGSIVLVVPNVEDALLSLYELEAFRDFYFTPAHQFYYSRQTLGKLFEKCGFQKFTIIPKQRYDLSNHMVWMISGRPGGMGKFNHAFDGELLDAYKKSLESRFLCDTLLAVIDVDSK
ncbi:MAG: class I SAM-dependent methyltransferase [bacterium]|nr:class I SAM-dependent methyltransferase [bacterium]